MKILIIGLPNSGRHSLLEAINDTYNGTKKYTINADFCPTVEARKEYNADVVIWCDTLEKNTTDIGFQRPQFSTEKIHCYVTTKNAQFWANHIINTIL